MQVFQEAFTAPRGLGPEFNAASCVSCHNVPTLGGGGSGRHTFVEWSYGDADDMLGRPRQRFALTRTGTVARAAVSDEVRRPPALLGLGLLEAIPLEELRRRVDPRDADRDGISGRLPWRDECYGRFGWQSSVCDIESFVVGALSRELGIETMPRSRSEISQSDLRDLVAFVRALQPPTEAAISGDGASLFTRVLCARCHVPIAGLARMPSGLVEVRAYTDLLVHEMGDRRRHDDRDSRSEFRTAPLWGVGASGPPYLHGGSAATLEDAILRHGGEATESRRRFVALTPEAKSRLLRFVATR